MVNLSNLVVIGLTGMSGAGKTTVSEILTTSGIKSINCDKISREVVKPHSLCLNEISTKIGTEYITSDGTLNRAKLGDLIFSSAEKRMLLNEIIYPYITYSVIRKLKELDEQGERFVLLDAPTLFESGIDDICDIIISVVSDRKASISRIMTRDNLTREQAENRLSSQHDEDYYRERSTYCIKNDGDLTELSEKTLTLLEKIRSIDGKS